MTTRRSRRAYADRLWSKCIKEKFGGVCFICQQTPVQAAHIIGRAHYSVRHNIHNGIALCLKHHSEFDSYKLDRDVLITAAIGKQAYEELKLAAQKEWDRDYDKAIAEIKGAAPVGDSPPRKPVARKAMGRLGGLRERRRANLACPRCGRVDAE